MVLVQSFSLTDLEFILNLSMVVKLDQPIFVHPYKHLEVKSSYLEHEYLWPVYIYL